MSIYSEKDQENSDNYKCSFESKDDRLVFPFKCLDCPDYQGDQGHRDSLSRLEGEFLDYYYGDRGSFGDLVDSLSRFYEASSDSYCSKGLLSDMVGDFIENLEVHSDSLEIDAILYKYSGWDAERPCLDGISYKDVSDLERVYDDSGREFAKDGDERYLINPKTHFDVLDLDVSFLPMISGFHDFGYVDDVREKYLELLKKGYFPHECDPKFLKSLVNDSSRENSFKNVSRKDSLLKGLKRKDYGFSSEDVFEVYSGSSNRDSFNISSLVGISEYFVEGGCQSPILESLGLDVEEGSEQKGLMINMMPFIFYKDLGNEADNIFNRAYLETIVLAGERNSPFMKIPDGAPWKDNGSWHSKSGPKGLGILEVLLRERDGLNFDLSPLRVEEGPLFADYLGSSWKSEAIGHMGALYSLFSRGIDFDDCSFVRESDDQTLVWVRNEFEKAIKIRDSKRHS